MNAFVGRQAVFDQHKTVVAYELLFREAANVCHSSRCDSLASYEVIHTAFLDIGLDRLLHGRQALLNLPQDAILDRLVHSLPPSIVKLEILETVLANQVVLDACHELRRMRYSLVLDDYVGQPEAEPFLDLVDWVKVDFRLAGVAEATHIAQRIKPLGKQLLAEKVETQAEFEQAVHAGYNYFQGFFLQRPTIVSGHTASPGQIQRLRLLSLLAAPEIDLHKIEQLISSDAALSYKILRYANSVRFGGRLHISSIRTALVRLGTDEVRRALTLTVLPRVSGEQNPELLRNSLVRARMCSELARKSGGAVPPERAFLIGLFSLLDAVVRVPMNRIVEELPLDEEISDALVNQNDSRSSLALPLQLTKSYEEAKWEDLTRLASQIGVSPTGLVDTYFEAEAWSRVEA